MPFSINVLVGSYYIEYTTTAVEYVKSIIIWGALNTGDNVNV